MTYVIGKFVYIYGSFTSLVDTPLADAEKIPIPLKHPLRRNRIQR